MRPSNAAMLLFLTASSAFALTLVDAQMREADAAVAMAQRASVVAEYGLTDLALFTEARYTRHPSQADLHSAFQDHPLALEHFPSGSLMPPPLGLVQPGPDR
jgi:hypothetical protein